MQTTEQYAEVREECRRSILVPVFLRGKEIYKNVIITGESMYYHILETEVNKRLTECTSIQESQFGCMPGRRTTYAIFGLKQTVAKQRGLEIY